jgi:ApaG protein
MAAAMSNAVTKGIRVAVRTSYLEERSGPGQFAFAYTIRISNEGDATAQLLTRHWIITNAEGEVQEVKGDGVVGMQPVLTPGESFEYTSGCVLTTPQGTMQGTYQMTREDGTRFDAEIAPFLLAVPNSLN